MNGVLRERRRLLSWVFATPFLDWSATAMGAELPDINFPPSVPSEDEVRQINEEFERDCIRLAKKIVPDIVKLNEPTITTYSKIFGPVWRADFEASYSDSSLINRVICWKPENQYLHIEVAVQQKLPTLADWQPPASQGP